MVNKGHTVHLAVRRDGRYPVSACGVKPRRWLGQPGIVALKDARRVTCPKCEKRIPQDGYDVDFNGIPY